MIIFKDFETIGGRSPFPEVATEQAHDGTTQAPKYTDKKTRATTNRKNKDAYQTKSISRNVQMHIHKSGTNLSA